MLTVSRSRTSDMHQATDSLRSRALLCCMVGLACKAISRAVWKLQAAQTGNPARRACCIALRVPALRVSLWCPAALRAAVSLWPVPGGAGCKMRCVSSCLLVHEQIMIWDQAQGGRWAGWLELVFSSRPSFSELQPGSADARLGFTDGWTAGRHQLEQAVKIMKRWL